MSLSSPVAAPVEADPRTPQRVRHQPRRRELNLLRVEKIAAHMIRVTLGGDLAGATGADGEPELESRDYTPRRYDPQAKTLDIEFVLHDAGPATAWAEQAKAGQMLRVGGPRGSFVIPFTFDWHLLIGDDTGLPAIARRLEELPAGTRAVVLAEVDTPADEVAFKSKAEVSVTYVHRNGAEAGSTDVLARGLKSLKLPKGDYYAWVACESLTAKALRAQLITDHGANPKWIRAAGYWRRGAVAVHENHND
jgi:NADPH-dependent ferric siderophore reductase